MTHDEVVDLLSTAAAFDRRKVGEADVIAWHAAVGDLEFADSQTAVVGHYTDTTEWLMPNHVRVRVKAIRARRLEKTPLPAPDPEVGARDYQAEFQRELKRIADGWRMPKAITAGGGAEPSEEYLAARGDDPHRELRVAAMVRSCPHCKALPNERCVDAADQPLTKVPAHDARLVAAGLAEWAEVNGQRRAELIEQAEVSS